MNEHRVKIWPEYLDLLLSGQLTSCVRRDDRGYTAGDLLQSVEINPETCATTGRKATWRITHVFRGDTRFGCDLTGFAVLSLHRCERILDDAVSLALDAVADFWDAYSPEVKRNEDDADEPVMRAALEAAAPTMLAAERERIAQAIEQDSQNYDVAFVGGQIQKQAANRAAAIARGAS